MNMVSAAFSVATFNVLAPCYRRLNDAKLATVSVGGRRPRESQFGDLWRDRCDEMCCFLKKHSRCDVVCLQEFWFADEYRHAVQKRFGDEYELVPLQRTGGKADGLATLVRKSKVEIVTVERLRFNDAGDRVALLTCLRLIDSNELVIVVNTHLTFPHSEFDRMLRQEQIHKVTAFVDGFLDRHRMDAVPVLVIGDFNGGLSDPVSAHLKAHCYTNALVHLTGMENVETHLNHKNEKVFVDHVWYRRQFDEEDHRVQEERCDSRGAKLAPCDFGLFPVKKEPHRWVEDFTISDHRLLTLTFSVEASHTSGRL
mmetsp:Transcript_10868/g.33318  ORF Transcript_10868/g.33318 Transcript_10868/m.33318 type:complete len:312 (+) Transcript_10868:47-982(+)